MDIHPRVVGSLHQLAVRTRLIGAVSAWESQEEVASRHIRAYTRDGILDIVEYPPFPDGEALPASLLHVLKNRSQHVMEILIRHLVPGTRILWLDVDQGQVVLYLQFGVNTVPLIGLKIIYLVGGCVLLSFCRRLAWTAGEDEEEKRVQPSHHMPSRHVL